ncbi:conserved hypothetical protein [Trichinella spiralis]|uniref:hypothetical protein n=1 Tax=Trichinella spiralis TaxID=6334 RepID=UPI0001EFBD1A|nr:conserved hypothetical protein [Trichinella spiralis]
MFTYISKKISIPNNTQLMCISWNHTDDYIACGGDRGLLKVIQLSTSAKQLDNTATGQSDVALNQTLEGHSGSIKVIVWNEKHQKLTTADDRGYINVWVLHNGIGIINLCFLCLRIFIGKIESNSGVWYEEMINSRNKSTVNSMKWSKDGNKICIAYNDGMVIVGSVDGNRLWSAEIKHSIVAVEWSPRDKLILLGASSGEIYVYDCKGNFQWSTPRYDLTFASQQRSLAIIFQQGYLQLMLNERDKEPVSANLPIRVITAKWNPSGTVLALVAEKPELPTGERSMIYFINSLGEWKYFSDTVVYSFISSESKDTCIAFWDTKSNEVHFKHVKELDFIDACKETYQIDNASLGAAVEYTGPPDKKTVDSICCIHATDSLLLIAKKSGQLCKYKFPSLLVLKPSKLKSRPTKMTLNCTNTYVCTVSTYLDPELLAVTEKNRLCIFKGTKAQVGQCNFSKDILCMDDIAFLQEPILFNARMCELSDVALRAIYLDDLIKNQKPNNVDYFLEIKTQPLQVATNFAKQKQLHELASFAEQTAHPAIWKLLAETAMLEWNFELAELAFIKLLDYNSIQFLRTLITISDEQLKRAEILSFLGDLEQAEKIYMNSDRIDLAIGLNQKYGNWTRVVELLRDDVGVENDTRLDQAYNAIGDQMAERNNWEQAAHYYELAHASEKLIQAYYLLDRFDDLRKLVDSLTDFDGLKKTAVLFSSGGLYNEAEVALLKCKECESNNLEMTNLSKQLTKLFKSHTQYQIVEQSNEITASKNIAQVVDAVRSCQKAGRYLEAAKLLHQLAKTDTVKTSGLSIMKQIHVLVALLIEEHKKRLKLKQSSKKDKDKTNNAILSDLLEDENKFENSNLIENAWKGAKAYHFYTLGQRFLYNALTSGHCGQFATCSKAFVKLEKLTSSNDTFAGENEYENLAFQIFKEHAVKDSIQDTFPCPTCSSEIPLHHTVCSNCDHSFSLCMVSGKTLLEPSEIWTCRRCCQLADKKSISDFSICVLCHNIND